MEVRLLVIEHKYEATVLSNGDIVCLFCNPWPKYCPYYDCAQPCGCSDKCDINTKWKFDKTFQSFIEWLEHKQMKHANLTKTPWYDVNF